MMKVAAIIVAAGAGRRFGGTKQFAMLKGKQVLEWSIAAFDAHPDVDEIILVLPDEKSGDRFMRRYHKISALLRGGPRRQDSVALGFERVDAGQTGVVLVHDGVRPLVSPEVISRVIAAARRGGAAVPGIPLEDTIKEAAGGKVIRTTDRQKLVRVQTPQGFAYKVLERALRLARQDHYDGTDDAGLVERIGHTVTVVEGDPRNIKVTTPLDLKIAEALIEE
jgi:2-C-methyl-D-erythritol 4-phosphate cytidylyltransferase